VIRIIGSGRLAALQAEAARVPGLQHAAAQAEDALQRAVEALRLAATQVDALQRAVAQAEAERAPQAVPSRPEPAGKLVPAHGIAYFGPDGDNAGGTAFYPDVYRVTCLCGWTQAGDGLSMILAYSGHCGPAPELPLTAHVVTLWTPESGDPGEAHRAACLCGWEANGDAVTVIGGIAQHRADTGREDEQPHPWVVPAPAIEGPGSVIA
jgi:hypothetical protein